MRIRRIYGMMAFFLIGGLLTSAPFASPLTISVEAPQDGALFSQNATSINGTADGPAIASRAVDGSNEFSNGSFNRTALTSNGTIGIERGNDTTVRYFSDFNYPDGTSIRNEESQWASAPSAWIASTLLSDRLPDAPALVGPNSLELVWGGVAPGPITAADVEFRYASTTGARLVVGVSLTGYSGDETKILTGKYAATETNFSYDFTGLVRGKQAVYIHFISDPLPSLGSYVGFDDLSVTLSFNSSRATGNWSDAESFDRAPFGHFDATEDQWGVTNSTLSPNGNSFVHQRRLLDSYNSTNLTYRLEAGSAILRANLAVNYSCDSGGRIAAYASSAPNSTETTLFASGWGVGLTSFSDNLTSSVGPRGLFLRFWAEDSTTPGACMIDDFALDIVLDTGPASFESGTYTTAPLDFSQVVNWTTWSAASSLPNRSREFFDWRDSANSTNWSAWVRLEPGSALPFKPSRYLEFRMRLEGYLSPGLPELINVTVSSFAIWNVTVSADDGASWSAAQWVNRSASTLVDWWANLTLGPGWNIVRVRVYDTSGAFVETNRSFFWDVFPPSTPARPTDGGAVTNASTLAWTWQAATDEGFGVVDYEVEVGTSPGAGDAVAPLSLGNETAFTFAGATDNRTYYLSVRARDGGGLWGNWSTPSDGILVDLTPPTIAKPDRPGPWATTPNITWTWAPGVDNGSGVAGYRVRIGSSPGGSDIVQGDAVSALSYTLTGAVDGATYYLAVRAIDVAGNLGPWSTTADVVRVDLVAPPTPSNLTGPAGYLNTSTATWTWSTVVDDGSGLAGYEIRVGEAPGLDGILPLTSVGGAAFTLSPMPDQMAAVAEVRAVDVAGNRGAWSLPSPILLVDRTAPEVLPAPTNFPSRWENASDLLWAWSPAGDAFSGIAGYLVRMGSSAGRANIVAERLISGTVFATSSAPEGAPLFLTIRAIDAAGNAGEDVGFDATQVDLTPPPPPTSIVGPPSPSNSMAPRWSWAPVTDASSGVVGYEVEVGTTAGGDEVTPWTAVGSPNYTFSPAAEGTFYLTVRAVDGVGWRSAEARGSGALLLDWTPPQPVEFRAWPPSTRAESVLLDWNASTDSGGAGLDGYEILTEEGSRTSTTLLPLGVANFEVRGLEETTYTIQVRAVDRAGNPSSWSPPAVILFDRTAPSAPAPVQVTVEGEAVSLSWPQAVDAGSGVQDYAVFIGRTPAEVTAQPPVRLALNHYAFTGEPGAAYFIMIEVTDVSGNTNSSGSSPVEVHVPAKAAPRAPGFEVGLAVAALLGVAAAARASRGPRLGRRGSRPSASPAGHQARRSK